jgi:hypothetical protein
MVCSALEALESLQNTKIHLQITETDLLKSHSIDISLFKELRSAQPFPCIYSDEVFAPYASWSHLLRATYRIPRSDWV